MRTGETMIARDMLKPGDHIYRYGKGSSYTHHGIYVGEEMVIHYTSTGPDGTELISRISSSSSHHNSDSNACPKCNYKRDLCRGVVKTCLECFLSGQKHIHLYKYGVLGLQTLFGPNPGGTPVRARPPPQVVNFASDHLGTSEFGNYNLLFNNCEDFACYCKTGVRGSRQFRFVVFYMTTVVFLLASFSVNSVFEMSQFKFVVLYMMAIVFLLATELLVVFRVKPIFLVFYTMTIGFLLATEQLVVLIVKFVFEMFSLSLLEFEIRVALFALFALIQLLETSGLFSGFSFGLYVMSRFDKDIRRFLVLQLAGRNSEYLIYITPRFIFIISWLEFNLFCLMISGILVLLKLFATLVFFTYNLYLNFVQE